MPVVEPIRGNVKCLSANGKLPRSHTIAIVLSCAATSLIDNTKLSIGKDFVPMKSPYEVTTGLAAAFDVEIFL